MSRDIKLQLDEHKDALGSKTAKNSFRPNELLINLKSDSSNIPDDRANELKQQIEIQNAN